MDDGPCGTSPHQKQHHQSAQLEHGILPSNPGAISIGIRRVVYRERHTSLSMDLPQSGGITKCRRSIGVACYQKTIDFQRQGA